MDIRFDGKKALVTGAGKGIGRAIALRLAECGAEVIAASRTQSDLDELAAAHSNIKTLLLDVSDWETAKNAIKDIGPVDLLVNNAAVSTSMMLGEIKEENIDRLFNINVKSLFNITQEVANEMKAKGQGGAIVNISSIAGFKGAPSYSIYCASKGAADQLTRCMACEYGPHNIRVNAVNPTAIRTKMAAAFFDPDNQLAAAMKERTPLKRFGEVDEIAYPVLFLLSDKASLINGVTLPIDGGLTVQF